jgi:GAF domain-containing protein
MHTDRIGLMVLCEPKLGPQLDYEDIDLLKTVGSQVAAVLRQYQADELLARVVSLRLTIE